MVDRRAVAGGPVVIIDDCAIYREALTSALTAHGVGPVRSAWDLPSLVAVLEARAPLVILVNLATLEVRTFLHATASLCPDVPVIAIGACEKDEEGLVACAEAGVAAYHRRADSLATLLVLIRTVLQGRTYCPPDVAAILHKRVQTLGDRSRPAGRSPRLTARETQVLRLIEMGQPNQEIAAHLSIAVHTVKSHVHSLLSKLGVSSRAEAAALARRLDLDRGPPGMPGPGTSRN